MLLALQAIKNKKYGTKTFQQKKNTQRNHDFVVCQNPNNNKIMIPLSILKIKKI